MLNPQISYAKKVAKNYVNKTNEERNYHVAYNIGLYVYNTGKYNKENIEKFLEANEFKSDINMDAIIMTLINVKFDEDEKKGQNELLKNNNRVKKSYPDKEAILNKGFEKCTRRGYEALQATLDEFDSDEMKIIRKFVEKYAYYFDMIEN